MKVLLDECIDWRLLRDLPGIDVTTVKKMGWSETINGALLALADQHFDVFVTVDRNLSYQQNLGACTSDWSNHQVRHLRLPT